MTSRAEDPTASIVVATYNRPGHVAACLQHLDQQTVGPLDVLVVDASPDRRTAQVVQGFPGVRYLRNERGAGSTATSRRIGFDASRGDIVVFVDDDAYAAPDWLENLLKPYGAVDVGAVGGRALNGQPNEEHEGCDEIGRLLPDGSLTGYFAANPGHDVEVDHLLGANMSVRRSAVQAVGGIQDFYPGTCLREETDIALRLRRADWRVVFTPQALVQHVAGPYARGRRFDLRYTYYGSRNHVVLLARTLGVRDPHFRRYLGKAAGETVAQFRSGIRAAADPQRDSLRGRLRGLGGGAARGVVTAVGTASGLLQAARLEATHGRIARRSAISSAAER